MSIINLRIWAKVKTPTSIFLIHTLVGDSSLKQPNCLILLLPDSQFIQPPVENSRWERAWNSRRIRTSTGKSSFISTFIWIFIGVKKRVEWRWSLGWFSLPKQRNDSCICQFGNFIHRALIQSHNRLSESMQSGLTVVFKLDCTLKLPGQLSQSMGQGDRQKHF